MTPSHAVTTTNAASSANPADPPTTPLLGAVAALREQLGRVSFPLSTEHSKPATQVLGSVVAQLDDYVLPRLRELDAPLLAVVGGSTGAGKSTLVNTLVGRKVSATGVLRPTTRSPVLVHHPDDLPWFDGDRILPRLERTGPESAAVAAPGTVQLVESDNIPAGLAILDAPDLDSVVSANRELAAELLAAADLWIFVTTAARYADAVPWDSLRTAAERGAAVAVVLDRVPEGAADEVTGDFARMLAAQDLGDAPLFVIRETRLDAAGLLDEDDVEPLRGWLTALASDAASRAEVAKRTLRGAIASLSRRVPVVAAALDAQAGAVDQLRYDVQSAYAAARETVDEASGDGSLLRGEVLARWHEFVGTGDLMRGLEEQLGRFRDRIVRFFKADPSTVEPVAEALETGLEALLLTNADVAADRTVEAWERHAGGAELLAANRTRPWSRASRELRASVGEEVRAWQRDVLELVRGEGKGKRLTARFLSLGVNGLGVALMVVVFAHTGGLTGAEVGVAGGTSVVGQRLLEAIFGDQAVRELTTKARTNLADRVERLFDVDRARFLAMLEPVASEAMAVSGPDLRTTLRRVEAAR